MDPAKYYQSQQKNYAKNPPTEGLPSLPSETSGPMTPSIGTPLFPYAATGSIQYAQKFFYSFNSTHNATLLASCTSVYGEPTRGTVRTTNIPCLYIL